MPKRQRHARAKAEINRLCTGPPILASRRALTGWHQLRLGTERWRASWLQAVDLHKDLQRGDAKIFGEGKRKVLEMAGLKDEQPKLDTQAGRNGRRFRR